MSGESDCKTKNRERMEKLNVLSIQEIEGASQVFPKRVTD
jgi:hypothetical protein